MPLPRPGINGPSVVFTLVTVGAMVGIKTIGLFPTLAVIVAVPMCYCYFFVNIHRRFAKKS